MFTRFNTVHERDGQTDGHRTYGMGRAMHIVAFIWHL